MTTAQSIGALGTSPTPNMKKQDDDERQGPSFAAISQTMKQENAQVPGIRNIMEADKPAALKGLPANLYGPAPDSAKEQSAQAPDAADESQKEQSALQQLRDYMELSPAEQIRVSMLNDMGLTEEELEKLPPEEQQAIEAKITQRIDDTLNQDATQMADSLAGSNSAASISGMGNANHTGMDQAIRLHQAVSFANGA